MRNDGVEDGAVVSGSPLYARTRTHTHTHTHTVYAEQLQVCHDCWFCICGIGRIFESSSLCRSNFYCAIHNFLYNNIFLFFSFFYFSFSTQFFRAKRICLVLLFIFHFEIWQYTCNFAPFFCNSFIMSARQSP